MTTIATDGKIIAADTQQIGQYIDQIEAVKLFKIKDEIVGIAGDYAEARQYLEWLQNGKHKDKKPAFDRDANFEAIHLNHQGVFHVTKNMYRIAIGTPAACGSGGDYAMAAMMAGAGPQKAVEIAIKLDPHSGGRVVYKRLGK